jgi:hypothetical protein
LLLCIYSEVATLARPYSDLGSIGGAALDMASSARGITLSAADQNRILQDMPCVASSPPPKHIARSQTRLDFLSIGSDSWQHTRGISLARSVRDALQPCGPSGKVLNPLGPTPDIIAPDFRSVAKQIVAAESPVGRKAEVTPRRVASL